MDWQHEAMLTDPDVAIYFDPNHQRNQFLTEFIIHRALLVSPHRVMDPALAHYFFVPFYSRLAYADRVASRSMKARQINMTQTLYTCLKNSRWMHRRAGTDHLTVISSTRDPKKLFRDAWSLLRGAITLRIENHDPRYKRNEFHHAASIVIPYYVPVFPPDLQLNEKGRIASVKI